jgi:hypothetical protein
MRGCRSPARLSIEHQDHTQSSSSPCDRCRRRCSGRGILCFGLLSRTRCHVLRTEPGSTVVCAPGGLMILMLPSRAGGRGRSPVCPASPRDVLSRAVTARWSGRGGGGGPQAWVHSCCHAGCQGQWSGRCSTTRRAECASRPGTMISWRRMAPVVALGCRARRARRRHGSG